MKRPFRNAESHDQALVGDKTIIFRLIDADMYWHMQKGDENYVVNRGIALHKMIRLLTSSTINGGYLNFMGNDSGIPNGLTSRVKVTDGHVNMPVANGIW